MFKTYVKLLITACSKHSDSGEQNIDSAQRKIMANVTSPPLPSFACWYLGASRPCDLNTQNKLID